MFPHMSELIIVFLIVLVLFGAGKIPRIAEDMGKGLKAFKKGVSDNGDNKSDNDDAKTEEKASCGCSCSCSSGLDAQIAAAKAEVETETADKEQTENSEEKA